MQGIPQGFQFQTGSIRREHEIYPNGVKRLCFNSKLVRLEDSHEHTLLQKYTDRFNSKLVRLEVYQEEGTLTVK